MYDIKTFDEFYSQDEVNGFLKDNNLGAGEMASVRATIIGMLRDGDEVGSWNDIQFRAATTEYGFVTILDPYNAVVGTGWTTKQ